VIREFRGATFEIEMRREKGIANTVVVVDGQMLPGNRITKIEAGRTYRVPVATPA
jgi:cellobionic acid phosphorylase